MFSVALGYIKHPAMTRIARQPLRSPQHSRPTPARVGGSRGTHARGSETHGWTATGGGQGALSRLLCRAGCVLGVWERPR